MKKVLIISGSIILCLLAALAGLVAIADIDDGANGSTLVFQSADASAEYNGTPLHAPEWKLVSGELKDGHVAKVSVTGSQTDVGEGKNTFTVSIFDKNGKNVSDQYEISMTEGTLSVYKRNVEFVANSLQKAYDGTPLTCDGYQILSGSILEGHRAVATCTGELTDVGVVESRAALVVFDENGNDVSANYELVGQPGTLTVIKRRLSLRSPSVERVYNGVALSADKISIVEGSLAPEQELISQSSAKLTGVGELSNKFTVTINDLLGNDVTDNYDIAYNFGVLRVLPSRITVFTGSDTKVYDGTEFDCQTFGITSGSVALGENLTAVFSTVARNVGIYENKATFSVVNAAGIDTTKNYIITVVNGTVEISERSLLLSSPDSHINFGDPLEEFEVSFLEGTELVEGHSLSVIYMGLPNGQETGENKFSAVVYDEKREDVTSNYNIKSFFGELTVSKTKITIKSPDLSKTYDGTPLVGNIADLEVDGEVLPGHTMQLNMTGERTNAGESKNSFSVKIFAADGTDVTDHYNIESVFGNLTVNKLEIVIKSGSAEQLYDPNKKLTCDSWEIVNRDSIQIPAGETVNVTVFGERLSVGESPNEFTVEIVDQNGESVIDNYNVVKSEGALVVIGDDPVETAPYTVLKVKTSITDRVYLRFMSYKDLVGRLEAKPYSEMLDSKYSYGYLSGTSLKNSGESAKKIEIENYRPHMYVLPSYPVMKEGDYLLPTNDVINLNEHDGSYSLHYYSYAGYGQGLEPVPDEYKDEELAYRQYVYDNYLDIDSKTEEFMIELINENQFSKDDSDIIFKVSKYIMGAAKYDLSVADRLDKEDDMIIAFLTTYKKGVCRHYAAAATAMFRTLGIPARYTVGFAANTTAGKWVEVTNMDAHAWVEVYVNGIGWITVEVTGSDQEKETLSLKPVTEYYKYNGEVHEHSGTIQGWDKYQKKGFTIEATIEGESAEVGWTDVYITSIKIFDPYHNDVTDQFRIICNKGRIQTYLYEITIKSDGMRKEYDGSELTYSSYSVKSNTYTGSDHNITVNCTGKITNVGTATNNFSVTITDQYGNNITDHYHISKDYGVLEVYARLLNVIVENASKHFDGTPLESDVYRIEDPNQLVSGHYIGKIEITGSQTKVGISDNEITEIKIYALIDGEPDPVDVTHNYAITGKSGTLRVYP